MIHPKREHVPHDADMGVHRRKAPASIAGIAHGGSFFLKTGEELPWLVQE